MSDGTHTIVRVFTQFGCRRHGVIGVTQLVCVTHGVNECHPTIGVFMIVSLSAIPQSVCVRYGVTECNPTVGVCEIWCH